MRYATFSEAFPPWRWSSMIAAIVIVLCALLMFPPLFHSSVTAQDNPDLACLPDQDPGIPCSLAHTGKVGKAFKAYAFDDNWTETPIGTLTAKVNGAVLEIHDLDGKVQIHKFRSGAVVTQSDSSWNWQSADEQR